MAGRVPRVMVVADSGITSRAIEYWGGGGWSHMANVLADDSIIDARVDQMKIRGVAYPAGVQRRPAGYLDRVPRWVLLEIGGEEHYSRWLAALVSQLHKPYDSIGILDFLTGSVEDRNWREQTAWFCSELGVWALERAGLCPALPDPIFRVTPGGALLLCIGRGARVVASRG